MNGLETEMTELVVVAWIDKLMPSRVVKNREVGDTGWEKLVRLSDAEALIDEQAAEIIEQARIIGMGAEREATLLGKVERQSAALKLAREALFDMQDSYAAVHGWKDSFVIAATTALAAINEVLKGE